MSAITTSTREFKVGDRVVIIPHDIYAYVLDGQGVIREISPEDKVTVEIDGGYEQTVPTRDLFFEADVLEGAITLLAPHDGEGLDEEEAGGGWTLLEDPPSMPFLLEEPHARRFVTEAREDELLIYYRPGQIPVQERLRLMVEVGRCRVVYPATGAVAPVEVVDIDELVTARGGDPDGPDPLGVLRNAEGEYTGVVKRLGAALDSMLYRADGNSALHIAVDEDGPIRDKGAPGNPKTWAVPFSWVSLGGEWSHRAWAVTGAVEIEVDDYLSTKIRATGVEITVVGTGGATRFVGVALGVYVGRAVRAALAREQARALIGHTSCIGDTPVQESPEWSPERFATLARALRGDGCWFAGQRAFQEIPGLPR